MHVCTQNRTIPLGEVEYAAECPRPHPAIDDVRADELPFVATRIDNNIVQPVYVDDSEDIYTPEPTGNAIPFIISTRSADIRTYTMTLLCQQEKEQNPLLYAD